jgi:hypothetical protein
MKEEVFEKIKCRTVINLFFYLFLIIKYTNIQNNTYICGVIDDILS